MISEAAVSNSQILYSVIIVNYFSHEDLKQCIPSILNKSSNLNLEIIIVSNSYETQEEIGEIRSLDKKITYIQLEKNLGFSTANNIGVTRAKGEFIFFLNPDTILQNDVLKILSDFLNENPKFLAVGPAVFDKKLNQTASVNNIPSTITLINSTFPVINFIIPSKFRSDNYVVSNTSEVPVIQGSSIFIKKKDFEDIGCFNEDLFLYSEETDLCFRIKKIGKKVGINVSAIIIHIGGTSTSSNFLKLEIVKHQSRKKFLIKHKPRLLLLNRVTGIIGYFNRFIVFKIFRRNEKAAYFHMLFKWYLTEYK